MNNILGTRIGTTKADVAKMPPGTEQYVLVEILKNGERYTVAVVDSLEEALPLIEKSLTLQRKVEIEKFHNFGFNDRF